eukprot:671753-Prymnesium_polylepis.1
MGDVALQEKAQTRGARGPTSKARVSRKCGQCAYTGCKIAKPKRPQLRCGACGGGSGRYYHLPCFFATHRCVRDVRGTVARARGEVGATRGITAAVRAP